MKKFFIALCLIASVFFTSCFEDKAISIVKNGHFSGYTNMTVGEAVDGFFANQKWTSGIPVDEELSNFMLVNVEGKILYNEKKVNAEIQFLVDEDTGVFELYAFEMNGIPQNDIMKLYLIESMFEN